MSIFPATDLISDVGRAAIPLRKSEALHRLERFAFSAGGVAETQSTTKTVHNYRDVNASFVISTSKSSLPSNPLAPDKNEASVAFRKFEAFILQTWLELLLPTAESGAYGRDQAGGFWRSLMAEQLGDQLARTGALGLARLTEHSLDQANDSQAKSKSDPIEESNRSRNPAQDIPVSPIS